MCEDGAPLGDIPCFVLTHNTPSAAHPTVYTFVTDGVASAIDQAKHAAGGKVVHLHGATVMQEALAIGLVDEMVPELINRTRGERHDCDLHLRRLLHP